MSEFFDDTIQGLLEAVVISKQEKADMILESFKIGLCFPFHIDHDLRQSEHFYNKNYNEFHEHSFDDIILRVYEEPKAFYLTEDDKKCYSEQEIEVIERIRQWRK